jgi:hypothetical protein
VTKGTLNVESGGNAQKVLVITRASVGVARADVTYFTAEGAHVGFIPGSMN